MFTFSMFNVITDIIGSKGWLYFNKLREEHGDVFTIFMGKLQYYILSQRSTINKSCRAMVI